jgi:hypothetical protein
MRKKGRRLTLRNPPRVALQRAGLRSTKGTSNFNLSVEAEQLPQG